MNTFRLTLLVALIALPACTSAQSKTETKSETKPPTETAKQETTTAKQETKIAKKDTPAVKAPAVKSPAAEDNKSTETKTTPVANVQTFDLTFDDLAFEMKKGSKFERWMLTPKINSYHNSTVKLRGYIRPSFKQSGLTKFIFVRDNKECCFGGNAAIFDNVLVKLAKGTKTDFTVRPVTIEGKMYLKEYKGVDGRIWSIFRMSDVKVQ